MSKPRYKWWSHAKAIVRGYPALVQEYEYLHQQKVTPDYTGMPRPSEAGHTTEGIALRQLPACKQREYDAVTLAIEKTKMIPSGADRIRLISMVYWKNQRKLEDAAIQLHIHPQTAKNWHGDFVRLVGIFMGWMDGLDGLSEVCTREPK